MLRYSGELASGSGGTRHAMNSGAMTTDARGIAISYSDRSALDAFELALRQYQSYVGDAVATVMREKDVIAHVRRINESLNGPLDGEVIARFYERIIDEMRRIQRIEAEKDSES